MGNLEEPGKDTDSPSSDLKLSEPDPVAPLGRPESERELTAFSNIVPFDEEVREQLRGQAQSSAASRLWTRVGAGMVRLLANVGIFAAKSSDVVDDLWDGIKRFFSKLTFAEVIGPFLTIGAGVINNCKELLSAAKILSQYDKYRAAFEASKLATQNAAEGQEQAATQAKHPSKFSKPKSKYKRSYDLASNRLMTGLIGTVVSQLGLATAASYFVVHILKIVGYALSGGMQLAWSAIFPTVLPAFQTVSYVATFARRWKKLAEVKRVQAEDKQTWDDFYRELDSSKEEELSKFNEMLDKYDSYLETNQEVKVLHERHRLLHGYQLDISPDIISSKQKIDEGWLERQNIVPNTIYLYYEKVEYVSNDKNQYQQITPESQALPAAKRVEGFVLRYCYLDKNGNRHTSTLGPREVLGISSEAGVNQITPDQKKDCKLLDSIFLDAYAELSKARPRDTEHASSMPPAVKELHFIFPELLAAIKRKECARQTKVTTDGQVHHRKENDIFADGIFAKNDPQKDKFAEQSLTRIYRAEELEKSELKLALKGIELTGGVLGLAGAILAVTVLTGGTAAIVCAMIGATIGLGAILLEEADSHYNFAISRNIRRAYRDTAKVVTNACSAAANYIGSWLGFGAAKTPAVQSTQCSASLTQSSASTAFVEREIQRRDANTITSPTDKAVVDSTQRADTSKSTRGCFTNLVDSAYQSMQSGMQQFSMYSSAVTGGSAVAGLYGLSPTPENSTPQQRSAAETDAASHVHRPQI